MSKHSIRLFHYGIMVCYSIVTVGIPVPRLSTVNLRCINTSYPSSCYVAGAPELLSQGVDLSKMSEELSLGTLFAHHHAALAPL